MTDQQKPISGPAVVIENLDGNCPVQGEGFIDGWPFYFRARGEAWSLSVAEPGFEACGEEVWEYQEPYDHGQFAAGWMKRAEALSFIHQGAVLFSAWHLDNPAVDGSGRATALRMRADLASAYKRLGAEAQGKMRAEREVVRLRRALGLSSDVNGLRLARSQVFHMDRDGREDAAYG